MHQDGTDWKSVLRLEETAMAPFHIPFRGRPLLPAGLLGLTLAVLASELPAQQTKPAIGEKFPPELVNFVSYGKEPVFAAEPGKWDAKIRERGWILREGGLYKLWYTGYDGTQDGLRMLGYATSPDGIRWTRHARNPLDREHWIEDM